MKKELVVFRLAKTNPKKIANAGRIYPPTFSIPAQDIIYNEDGEQVRIAYCEGEKSIYVDKQSKFANPVDGIMFTDGFKAIPSTNKAFLEFMRVTNFNESIVNKVNGRGTFFKEINYQKEAEVSFQAEADKGRAEGKFWLLNEDPKQIRAIARKMGVSTQNPNWRNVMLALVRKNPIKFTDIIDDPQSVEFAMRLDDVTQAHSLNIITFSVGRWSWSGGDAFLAVAKGTDKFDYLVNWTFNDAEGRLVFKEIHAKTKGLSSDEAIEAAGIAADVAVAGVTHASLSDILAQCREADFVEWTGGKMIYHNEAKTEETVLGRSKTQSVEYMKNDPILLRDMKRRLMNLKS